MPQVSTKNIQFIRKMPDVGAKLGEAFDSHSNAISNISQQLALDPNGSETIPSKIGSLNAVHLANGLVDFAITDNSQRFRALTYWFEYRQKGNQTWRQVALSHARSPHPIMLPNGVYETRAYSQYVTGGAASSPVNGPTITVTNSAAGDAQLLESTGSGTAPSSGDQGGSGAGSNLTTNTLTGRNPILR